VSPRHLLTLTT